MEKYEHKSLAASGLNQKKHPISILSLDIDGTLVDEKKRISPELRETIRRLKAEGVHIVLNSGRPRRGMEDCQRELGMDSKDYLISNTGCLIHCLGDPQPLLKNLLAVEDFWKVKGLVHQPSVQVVIGTPRDVYREEGRGEAMDNLGLYFEINRNGIHVCPLEEMPEGTAISRILLLGEKEAIDAAYPSLDPLREDYLIVRNEEWNTEVLNKKAGKGKSLRQLAGFLHLPQEEVMAVGDGHNDLEMLQMAGLSVCMGNGVDVCKEAADLVIGSNEENGLAEFLLAYFFGESL